MTKITFGYIGIGLGLLVMIKHMTPMQVVGVTLLVLGTLLFLDGKKYG